MINDFKEENIKMKFILSLANSQNSNGARQCINILPSLAAVWSIGNE
jgi:hypothetical protein